MNTQSATSIAKNKLEVRWWPTKVTLNATAAAGFSKLQWNALKWSRWIKWVQAQCYNVCCSIDNSMLLRAQLQLQSVPIQSKMVFKATITAQCGTVKLKCSEVKWSKWMHWVHTKWDWATLQGSKTGAVVPKRATEGFQTPQMMLLAVLAIVETQTACADSCSG